MLTNDVEVVFLVRHKSSDYHAKFYSELVSIIKNQMQHHYFNISDLGNYLIDGQK